MREQTKHGLSVKRRIYSFPMKGESRAEAICRSFRQYTLVDWTQYNKVYLRIVTSAKYPLLMGELAQLQETLDTSEEKLLLIIQAYKDENESMD